MNITEDQARKLIEADATDYIGRVAALTDLADGQVVTLKDGSRLLAISRKRVRHQI